MTQQIKKSKIGSDKIDKQAWRQFVDEGCLKKGIKANDIQYPYQIMGDISGLGHKEAVTILKNHLSSDGYKRCDARWRQYKRRKVTGIKTISLKPETLIRLRALSVKAKLHEDNYDLLFEYLMHPENELENYKIHLGVADLPTGLNFDEQGALLRARLVLHGSIWRYLLGQIEYAFNAGWLACKFLNGKKRTEKVQGESAEEFMNKVKGF